MTTTKPEVVGWVQIESEGKALFDPLYISGPSAPGHYDPDNYEAVIRLSGYEALQAELETVKKVACGNIELLERNEALQAECDQIRKDADRYRWLCDKFGITRLPCAIERILSGEAYVADGKEGIDAAIDEAMQESKPCSLSS